jgi:hypothetical protein
MYGIAVVKRNEVAMSHIITINIQYLSHYLLL